MDGMLTDLIGGRLSSGRIRLFPLRIIQCYLSFTVLVFAFGPWPWRVPSPTKLYVFLFCAQAAFWIGYRSGIRQPAGGYSGLFKIERLVKFSLLVNIAWIIPNYMTRLGLQEFSFSRIIDAISTGFTNPATMYAARQAKTQTTSLVDIITLLLYPILWLLFPLTIVYWKKLSRSTRYCAILLFIIDMLSWIGIGTNKGVFDYIFLLPWLLVAASPHVVIKMPLRKVAMISGILFIGLGLFSIYFIVGQKGRGQGAIPTEDPSAMISIDKDNWMVRHLPPEAQSGVASYASYMIQGYYALSLALEEPFTWSYGVGNSYYLTGLVEHFVGKGRVSDRTFPAKIEKHGWDRFGRWHSFYTWIASDVSFPGTIIIVYIIGLLFAVVWLDVLRKENPFAVALFALLLIMVFYFPANNQVLGFASAANPFWALLACWLLTRRWHLRRPGSVIA